jgi:tRNA G18 (ribose-2'-O)-methylase SpoU
VTREQVYGRRPVREALRGPREVLEVWATERAAAAEPWLSEGPKLQIKPDREISEAAGTRDHQGVLAWTEPYRYADAHELAAVGKPRTPTTSAPSCAAQKARVPPASSSPPTAPRW